MIVPEDNLDVLISPTTRCNLRCGYCYVRAGGTASSDMTPDDVVSAFHWLRRYADLIGPRRIRMTWFGGEPTLLGAGFLGEALAIQESALAGYDVVSNIQTNLTLEVGEFIPVYRRHFRSTVGFSCDTPGGCRRFPEAKGDDLRLLPHEGICRDRASQFRRRTGRTQLGHSGCRAVRNVRRRHGQGCRLAGRSRIRKAVPFERPSLPRIGFCGGRRNGWGRGRGMRRFSPAPLEG